MAWYCPKCERKFGKPNQNHMCGKYDIDKLFDGKSDEHLLIFDKLIVGVIDWPEMEISASVNTIIFTSKTTCFVVRPMSKCMDVKFYSDKIIDSSQIFKTGEYSGKYYYHIRISKVEEMQETFFNLLKIGYNYSMR